MEEQTFIRYVSLYQNTVYRVAFSYVKNTADSEDITQEVFIKLYKCREIFSQDENVKAWLIRVAVNAAKDHLKSAWMRKRITLEENTEIAAIEKKGLEEVMEQLNGKYRIVLYLYYFEEYSVKEIAGLLHISQSNVKIRLKRGREALKEILEKGD